MLNNYLVKCLPPEVARGTSVIGTAETTEIETHRATSCLFHYIARKRAVGKVLKFSVDGISRDKIIEVKLLQEKAKEEERLADEALAAAVGSFDGILHDFVITQPEDNPNEGEEYDIGRQNF